MVHNSCWGSGEILFHRSPLRRQGCGKQQAPAVWVGCASESQAGRPRYSRQICIAARLRALLPLPWVAGKFLPFLPNCSKTQPLPESPITLSSGSAVGSLPCRHLPAPNLCPIWGKKNCSLELEGLLQWRGKARLENTQLQHPSLCTASPPVPASLGWGSGCQEGHPGSWKRGSLSPSLQSVRPSVPPQAMGSGDSPDLPARAASAALITPLAPGAGALRPNYDRSFAPAQSMPLTEALERQIRAPRPGKAAAASGVGDATTHGEMWRHRDALAWCSPSLHPSGEGKHL